MTIAVSEHQNTFQSSQSLKLGLGDQTLKRKQLRLALIKLASY